MRDATLTPEAVGESLSFDVVEVTGSRSLQVTAWMAIAWPAKSPRRWPACSNSQPLAILFPRRPDGAETGVTTIRWEPQIPTTGARLMVVPKTNWAEHTMRRGRRRACAPSALIAASAAPHPGRVIHRGV